MSMAQSSHHPKFRLPTAIATNNEMEARKEEEEEEEEGAELVRPMLLPRVP